MEFKSGEPQNPEDAKIKKITELWQKHEDLRKQFSLLCKQDRTPEIERELDRLTNEIITVKWEHDDLKFGGD